MKIDNPKELKLKLGANIFDITFSLKLPKEKLRDKVVPVSFGTAHSVLVIHIHICGVTKKNSSFTYHEHFSMNKLREEVAMADALKKKKEQEEGPKAAFGYGGKFGVQSDR